MKRIIAYTLALMCCFTVALAKDIKTLVVKPTPQMVCNNCETKIKKNLRHEKGIKDIVTNLDRQTITIKYDADKTTSDAIVKTFSKIGYTVTEVKCAGCCKQKAEQKSCCKQSTEQKSCCKQKAEQSGEKKSCCKQKAEQTSEKKSCCKQKAEQSGKKKSCCKSK